MMPDFEEMPNIGKVAKEKLIAAGISTPEELIRFGSREAFLRVKIIDNGVCLHFLYALEGAIQGVRKNFLNDETKAELRRFFNSLS